MNFRIIAVLVCSSFLVNFSARSEEEMPYWLKDYPSVLNAAPNTRDIFHVPDEAAKPHKRSGLQQSPSPYADSILYRSEPQRLRRDIFHALARLHKRSRLQQSPSPYADSRLYRPEPKWLRDLQKKNFDVRFNPDVAYQDAPYENFDGQIVAGETGIEPVSFLTKSEQRRARVLGAREKLNKDENKRLAKLFEEAMALGEQRLSLKDRESLEDASGKKSYSRDADSDDDFDSNDPLGKSARW